jgi:cyclopropane-fatty-acyl-phospholipid synthase
MTYSSARFDRASEMAGAQKQKYAALADKLQLKPGDAVLEIGCGWGGFAEHAARVHGARVTAITISDQQFEYAQARIAKAGLADKVEIRRQDYRDVQGRFDAVASIEMIEAVGEEYWPVYFGKIAEVLKPGGRAAIQAITIRDDLFETYRQRPDFIQHYIFPGGMLPSPARLRANTAKAGLTWLGAEGFPQSYARTLSEWARRFQDNWAHIQPQGFDERFRRLWLFYLAYCEAGFRTGRTDVIQLALKND